MSQPEANTTKSLPAHWINEEVTVLVNHMYDHWADSDGSGNFKPQVYNSAVTALNDDPELQPKLIGPAKNIKMVKNKWAAIKTIHHAIDKYCNQTGTHWDSINGAGIYGDAASAVWDSYVSLKANHPMRPFRNTGWVYYDKMLEILPLGGAKGHEAHRPKVMGPLPPPVADDEAETGPPQAPVNPEFAAGVPSIAIPPTAALSIIVLLPLALVLATTTSVLMRTLPLMMWRPHHSCQLSQQLTSLRLNQSPLHWCLPPHPKNHVRRVGLRVSKRMSNAAKMSSATQAAKISPAVAVMGMQGTVNRLTDVFENFVMGGANKEQETAMNLVERAITMLQTEDDDMSLEQQASLMTIIGGKDNEHFLKFYVSLTDKQTWCAFVDHLMAHNNGQGSGVMLS
ncbi:hypothetical protein BDR07DRAFT_1585947 [Suillus spraguei]|nr:hypothetical protein BDR07DRAFT_1585947 [Suillus spraguei]